MRRAPVSIVGIIILCISCGATRVAQEEATLPNGSPIRGWTAVEGVASAPALRAEVPWVNRDASLGWGAMRIWGRPLEDVVRVSAIVDAPARARRWAATCEVRLRADGREIVTTGGYVGRPMEQGVYDAVRIDLGIEDLRAIGAAGAVEGVVCGDRFVLDAPQRATVQSFVEQFDDLAVPHGPTRGLRIEVGPDVVMPGDEEIWPTPA